MLKNVSTSKERLSKLPDDVLSLISMGQYSLYKIKSDKVSDAAYASRVGTKEVYFLNEEGQPVSVSENEMAEFEVEHKIVLNDVSVDSVKPKYSLAF